jgi:sugar O-acyltransferase (sialic acid O-acetyltransferase NeuD family)
MRDLVIIGAGGFGREVLDVVDAINEEKPTFNMVGFLVEAAYFEKGQAVNEVPVLGDLDWLKGRADSVSFVVGTGDPATRQRLAEHARSLGVGGAVLVHPQAIVTRWVKMGEGTIVTAGCVLTNNIELGEHVHVNLDCTIGHDVVIGSFTTLSPGVHVSGSVTTGEGTFVGTGVNIVEKVALGEWCRVGAGSTVIKDVPADSTAIGVPAVVVRQRDPGWQRQA